LEQETAKLKGESPREEFSAQFDIDVDYYIPDSYIPDSGAKIRIYRKLLLAADMEDINEVRAEMLDRFGALPRPVENFLSISHLRLKARGKAIKSLRRKGKEMEIVFAEDLPADINQRLRGCRIKSLHKRSLLLNLEGSSSLELLGEIMDMI
jgi:transcription-repair coupling factor (superfamily II helicase)